MITHIRSSLIGIVIGSIATWLVVCRHSQQGPLRVGAKPAPIKLGWSSSGSASRVSSGEATLRARVWFENGACYLLEPVSSLEAWNSGQSPTSSSPPAFRVTDQSFQAREWLLKTANGGVSRIVGHMTRVAEGPSWLLGEFDRVDEVVLDDAIETSWDKLERNAAGYHQKAIKVLGTIGRHPQLPHLYLYPNEDAWKSRSHEKALMLERTFVPHDDSSFELLGSDGVAVAIEGVYRRPFRDDGEAPSGSLTVLHRIIARPTGNDAPPPTEAKPTPAKP